MTDTSQSPNRFYQAIDAVVYALAVTALVLIVSTVLAAVFTDDISDGVVLFSWLSGIVILGYGTLKLRPSAAWKKERSEQVDEEVKIARTETERKGETITTDERTAFQARLQQFPPLRRYSLPPDQRLSTGTKMFLSGVFVWAASLLTDVVLNGAFR